MVFIGIDPGRNGGIAFLTDERDTWAKPYRDEYLVKELKHFNPENVRAVVEEVHAMPGNGATSMFSFGKAFGYILGVLEAYRIPYELVKPQKWKKEFGCTSDKQRSIDTCRRLFPELNLKVSERARKDHDGIAEAMLMAEYARRHLR